MLRPSRRRPASAYGVTTPDGRVGTVPITGILGDQHAGDGRPSLFCSPARPKYYGTGNFLLLDTGEQIVRSRNGLLTTVCYQSVTETCLRTGRFDRRHRTAVQWLRDQLGIISGAAQSEALARQVDDNAG